jgi:hypothetical protein
MNSRKKDILKSHSITRGYQLVNKMTLMHIMSYAICVIASYELKHLMHCTILPLARIHSFTLGHAELEFGEPIEEAQAKDLTNLALDQGKLRCI